jgi:hypothetical protein
MPVQGFVAWLKQFKDEDSPRGDLARDMLCDRDMRNAVITHFGYVHRRLGRRIMTPNALQVAWQAWLLYKKVARTTREEAAELLRYAKSVCPALEPNGIEGCERFFDEEANHDRYLDEIAACADFLSLLKRRKTLNPAIGSYGLKHRVEEVTGMYISNGSLIAAAIALEIPMRRYPEYKNPNVYFALSSANNLEPADWNY